jgi:hypothetical protein
MEDSAHYKTMLFIQTPQDEFALGYLVPFDPLEHPLIYQNLLKFEQAGKNIEIFLPRETSPELDKTTNAWFDFCHSELVRSHVVESNARNLAEISRARFWVWYTHE